MGGGVETFEKNQQYMKVLEDLKEVNLLINRLESKNLLLFDTEVLFSSITKDISDYFETNGIKYRFIPQGGLGGGGGLLPLFEIIKIFWQNKEILTFLFSILSYIKVIYFRNINKLKKKLEPRVSLNIWIESNSDVSRIHKELNEIIVGRLINLLLVSNAIAELLSQKYLYLRFDLKVFIKINSINYSVTFHLLDEERQNRLRFIKIIKDLKIRKNFSSEYFLTNWFAIKRLDSQFNNSRLKYKRKYYLLLSSKLLKDY